LIDVIDRLSGWEIVTIGAYFSYVKHPYEELGSIEVAQRLATQNGVICLPGAFFGEEQEDVLRFAFANVDSASLNELSDRLQ